MGDDIIIARIEEYLELDGSTANSFANQVGIDPGNFRKMLAGKQKITDKTLRKIADAHGVSFEWLKYGEGEMFIENETKTEKDTKGNLRPRLPMKVAAGMLSVITESAVPENCELVQVVKAFPDYDFTMIITGDSMEPKFEGGDEIALKKVTNVIEWGKPYVLDTRDGAVLKRIYDAGEKLRCVSYNKEYPDFMIDKNDILGVYRIVGQLRY